MTLYGALKRVGRRAVASSAQLTATLAAAAVGQDPVALVAVAVGWAVIAGSCIRSLPQVLRILKSNR